MNEVTAGLLPEGLRDRLPPQAEAAAALLRGVLDTVASHGYERVQPPLVEYEESLTGRVGGESGGNAKLLRFVDPVTQRTLALRLEFGGRLGIGPHLLHLGLSACRVAGGDEGAGQRQRALVGDRARAAREDHGFGLELGEGALGGLEGRDFAIDAGLAHPARDELGHLRAKIDDQHLVVMLDDLIVEEIDGG